MSQLWAKVCTIDGEEHGLISDFTDLSVEWPWLDSRTGSITVPMDSPSAGRLVSPIETLVKVYYGDVAADPVLTGHVVKPLVDFGAGTITVPLHDPTLKLKHGYHRFGDVVVDDGYPLDGRGMRRLCESAIPSPRALALGCKPSGITWGADTATRQGEKPTKENGSLALWGQCQRGEGIWDSLLKAAQKANGPDFDFRPDDDLPAGYFVRLRTGDKLDNSAGRPGTPLSEDKSSSVQFIYGVNADGFTVEPDGDAIRNYYVAVAPGGERSRENANDYRATVNSFESWQRYGILQGWESVGETIKDRDQRVAMLEEDARQWVDSYAYPPTYFTVSPRQDAPNVPKLLRDFEVGDIIGAAGKRLGLTYAVTGRVMKATLSQAVEGSGQARLAVECAPIVAAGAGDDGQD